MFAVLGNGPYFLIAEVKLNLNSSRVLLLPRDSSSFTRVKLVPCSPQMGPYRKRMEIASQATANGGLFQQSAVKLGTAPLSARECAETERSSLCLARQTVSYFLVVDSGEKYDNRSSRVGVSVIKNCEFLTQVTRVGYDPVSDS